MGSVVQPSRLRLLKQSGRLHHILKLAEHQRIALWTPLRGAAVFETVSSSVPDVLRFKMCPHQDLHLEPRPLEAAYALLLHLAGLNWLLGLGSHQRGRFNRAASYC